MSDQKWEYQALAIDADVVAVMNKAGEDGWQAVCIIGAFEATDSNGVKHQFPAMLVKRPKSKILQPTDQEKAIINSIKKPNLGLVK